MRSLLDRYTIKRDPIRSDRVAVYSQGQFLFSARPARALGMIERYDKRKQPLSAERSRLVSLIAWKGRQSPTGRSPRPVLTWNVPPKPDAAPLSSYASDILKRQVAVREQTEAVRTFARAQLAIDTKLAETLQKKSALQVAQNSEVSKALLEIKNQARHFKKLGEGKPDDHEYNVLARGFERMYINRGYILVGLYGK